MPAENDFMGSCAEGFVACDIVALSAAGPGSSRRKE